MQPNDPAQASPSSPYGQLQPGQSHNPPAGPPTGQAYPGAGYPPQGQPVQGQPVQGQPAPEQLSGQWPGQPPVPGGQQPVGGPAPVSGQPAGYLTPPGGQTAGPYARVPGPGPVPQLRILIGDALAAFGGLLVFLFSFAPFVSYDDERLGRELDQRHLPDWFSAWATETFMAPLTWFVVLAGLIAISISASRLAIPRDREVAGFRASHLQIGATFFMFVVMFGYAMSAKRIFFGHDLAVLYGNDSDVSTAMSFGWGGWLLFLGSIVAAVGAVMSHLELGPVVYPQPPRPAAPPQMGYPAPGAQPYQQADNGQATAVYPTVGGQQQYPQQSPAQPGYPQQQAAPQAPQQQGMQQPNPQPAGPAQANPGQANPGQANPTQSGPQQSDQQKTMAQPVIPPPQGGARPGGQQPAPGQQSGGPEQPSGQWPGQ